MNDRDKVAAIMVLLAVSSFSVVAIEACRKAYNESQEVTEVGVSVSKRLVPDSIDWHIAKCQPLIKNEDGSVKTGRLGEYLDCQKKAIDEVIESS